MLVDATHAGHLPKDQRNLRATMGPDIDRKLKTALCASPVAQVTHVYS